MELNYLNEIWKDIEGYEGLYQISNYGRLRSFVDNYGHKRITIRKFQKTTKGYLQTRIYKDGKAKTVRVHRLVAEAFIPNPNNLPQVNHKDEDKTNNFIWVNPDGSVDLEKSNLEWCDNSYNQLYGTMPERKRIINTNHPSKSAPVKQYTLDGQFVAEYPSQSEAARQTGICQASIYNNCSGKITKTHNYIFSYAPPRTEQHIS